MWRQGYNVSDQVMARALMTPDELRRLDSDKCIILEKGIKPIKADKYYYFKYKTNDLVKKYAVSHNDIEMDRGVWRKYNPYNPYVESEEEHPNNNIESLDDLFEEDEKKEENENKIVAEQTAPKEETKEVYDIQKELEEKFDELFGSLDDNNNATN